MASSAGYVLLPKAILPDLAKRGADAISNGLKQTGKSEKITEYEVSPVSKEIESAFIENENNKALIATLVEPNPAPSTVKFCGIGTFNTTKESNAVKTGKKDDVYVTIALQI